MNIKQLIADLPVTLYRGRKESPISGLCSHSKLAAPGNLFVAKKGSLDDGAKYIDEALASGAAAILTDMHNPFIKEVPQLIAEDVQAVEAEIVARFYGEPSNSLYMVGVTGTNGKTTISYLVKHLFDYLGSPCGMIGTIEYIIGSHHFSAQLTTPEVITTHKLLREMNKQGCESAVMEVSSIGLEQGRVAKVDFDLAIFSNLSPEHLDYHKTMEAYAGAKSKLFTGLKEEGMAIVNLDCPFNHEVTGGCRTPKLTYGLKPEADLYGHSVELRPGQTSFQVTYQGQTLPFSWGLIGRFNVYNCLAAIGAALIKGFAFVEMPEAVAAFSPVPGRLEKVENLGGLHIYVDYAHTPDALDKALRSLSEVKTGRILTVFGAGGDRDRQKRPQMAEAVERYSDFTVVTADNPRGEDPLAICQEIVSGFSRGNFTIEVDRRTAIEKVIEMAAPEDLILIAGKGHETYQIFSRQTVPFDDRLVAQEIANRVTI